MQFGSDSAILIALIIFIITYLAIAVGNFGKFKVSRYIAAIAGGAAMIVLGIISFSDALSFINTNVLLLLFGMMLLVAGLEFSGLFEKISDLLITHSGSKIKMLILVMILSALLSAIALNDAVVLIFTPIVIRCCIKTKANPIPYLVALIISANIGSVATIVGNPQNAYVAEKASISFLEFSAYSLPLMIICMIVAFGMIYLVYRKNLESKEEICVVEHNAIVDPLRLKIMICILIMTVVGFSLSSFIGVGVHTVALIGGSLAFITVITKGIDKSIWMIKRVDWTILIFFIGLFVLMGGVEISGLAKEIINVFPGFGPGETPSIPALIGLSALLANLVSNVPSTMLIGSLIPAGSTNMWIVLAASSTLAGNATLLGAAANIIVSEGAEKHLIKINFWKYLAIGIPVAVVTLLISIAYFSLIW